MRVRRDLEKLALALLLAALSGCGEEHHYVVDLDGHSRRADADGNPLPEELPAAAPAMPTVKGALRGMLTIDPSVQVDPSAFACVFLYARRAGSQTVDVVSKVEHPQFPLEFTLASDGMHGAGLADGNYTVYARLDSDGDAQPRQGDVDGVADAPSRPGGAPVNVILVRVLDADGPAPQLGSAPAAGGPAPVAPVAPFAGGGMTESAPSPEDLAGPRFKGTVELAPEFAAVSGKYTLYVILRSATAGGMPLAPKRFENATFPVSFDIGTEAVALDVDNKREILSSELKVYARLSLSGNPLPQPGDIESEPVITAADKGPIVLTLSKKRAP